MQLARVYLPSPGRALVDCCAAFDIELEGAHRASVDAYATAQLLASYIAQWEDRTRWTDHRDRATAYFWGRLPRRGVAWYPRENARSGNDHHFLERITDHLGEFIGPDAHNEYLALLDRPVDRMLSVHESERPHRGRDLLAVAALLRIAATQIEKVLIPPDAPPTPPNTPAPRSAVSPSTRAIWAPSPAR